MQQLQFGVVIAPLTKLSPGCPVGLLLSISSQPSSFACLASDHQYGLWCTISISSKFASSTLKVWTKDFWKIKIQMSESCRYIHISHEFTSHFLKWLSVVENKSQNLLSECYSSKHSRPKLGYHPRNKLNALEYHMGKLWFYHNEMFLIEGK